jgi:hypothetical protein
VELDVFSDGVHCASCGVGCKGIVLKNILDGNIHILISAYFDLIFCKVNEKVAK